MPRRTNDKPVSELLLPRRDLLRGGLATFASIMAARAIPGCSPSGGASEAGAEAGAVEAGTPEAGAMEAGAMEADAALDAAALADAQARDEAVAEAGAMFIPPRRVPARPALRSLISEIGPLGMPDANGVRVAPGFRSRVIGRTGEVVAGTRYEWHIAPDGGATFMTEDGGWIYTSNSEMLLSMGGVSAVRFNPDGTIRSAYRILERTSMNCAGGPTPWSTWLSCEETSTGRVHECDPWGEHRAIARPALGVFKHEAVTFDTDRAHVYLTEDETDGRFYRFVPAQRTAEGHPDLNAGRLEVASVAMDGAVTWREVPDPQFRGTVPTRMQVAESTAFNGGEGIWYHAGVVYFSTKGDNRVRAYDARTQRITVLYDAMAMANPPLVGVDNITVSCCGDVLVAEDQGSMQVVAILPTGQVKPLAQVAGVVGSEITGPAFDPSGTRLYFSSQRVPGVTFEVSGPFHAMMGG